MGMPEDPEGFGGESVVESYARSVPSAEAVSPWVPCLVELLLVIKILWQQRQQLRGYATFLMIWIAAAQDGLRTHYRRESYALLGLQFLRFRQWTLRLRALYDWGAVRCGDVWVAVRLELDGWIKVGIVLSIVATIAAAISMFGLGMDPLAMQGDGDGSSSGGGVGGGRGGEGGGGGGGSRGGGEGSRRGWSPQPPPGSSPHHRPPRRSARLSARQPRSRSRSCSPSLALVS
jgi:uncharacterized membrane protein YgcG